MKNIGFLFLFRTHLFFTIGITENNFYLQLFHSQKLCIQFLIFLYNQKLYETKLLMNLGAMIKEGNLASLQDRARTLIFLYHHLHEGLTKMSF